MYREEGMDSVAENCIAPASDCLPGWDGVGALIGMTYSGLILKYFGQPALYRNEAALNGTLQLHRAISD